jgi:hypothetical protein
MLLVLGVIGSVAAVAAVGLWFQAAVSGKAERGTQESHTIKIAPWGPDQTALEAVKAGATRHPAVQRYLKGARYRLLHLEYLEAGSKTQPSEPPARYRITFFDYSENRAILAEGAFNSSDLRVWQSPEQPNPSPEEFDAAVEIVAKDPVCGPGIRNKTTETYAPMPPLIAGGSSKGRTERTLSVGLMSKDRSNEIVGVNMIRQTVVRYPAGSPNTSDANALFCGYPSAGQSTTPRGTAGQWEVVISRGPEEIWRFLVIRPSASSGNNASGIEMRDVRFRNKLVLTRANAPILNVQYERNACGPFRDWSWQEGMFSANGSDVAPGIRVCTDEPQTILDSGSDFGNFRGVAIYDREDVTLVSELNAGWYRYISKWGFHDDGRIEPRFGFGAVINSCVCRAHTHHVYWRFDFDIATASPNTIYETGLGPTFSHDVEATRLRLYGPRQTWIISNPESGESCTLIPGLLDGNADKYSPYDLYLLKNHFPAEIDDSGQGSGTNSHLTPYVNGELIAKDDVVIWYAAHWRHDRFEGNSVTHIEGAFTVGPTLVLNGY